MRYLYKPYRHTAFLGQASTEFSLVAVLVAVAGIGVLTVLGSTIQHQFGSMLSTKADTSARPSAIVAEVLAKKAGVGSGSATFYGENLAVTLANGTTIALQGYPQRMSDVIETAGANGATRLFSDTLENLVAQLEAKSALTPEQASRLYALANKGHEIAEVQALLETLSKSASSSDAFAGSTVEYRGQTYLAEELGNEIGFYSYNSTRVFDAGLDNPDVYAKSQGRTREFLELLQQVQNQDALTDPVLKGLVDDLAVKIVLSSEITEDVLYSISVGETQPQKIGEGEASRATNFDAVGICSAGGGEDSGISCNG